MIDLNKVPVYVIDLAHLNEAIEITHLMKQDKIKKYCYAFEIDTHTIKDVMKFGHSADNEWKREFYGDRIYRQASHIPGWLTACSPNMWGNEMRELCKNYTGIDKSHVSITVWDMTHYPNVSSIYPALEVEKLESQLIHNYQETHKCLPIGNVRSEKYSRNKAVVADSTLNNILEFV